MNMFGAAVKQGSAAINQQAEKTGENIGEKLVEDQKNPEHSVETKMEAATEGMKESVQDGVSMLQTGISNAREVFKSDDVHEEIFVAMKPVKENPQFAYFNKLLEGVTEKAQQAADQGLSQIQAQVNDRKSFQSGQVEEQAKLEKIATEDSKVDEAKLSEQEDSIQQKTNSLLQVAGQVTRHGMDVTMDATKHLKPAGERIANDLI